MTKYFEPKMIFPVGVSASYRDNWDAVFGNPPDPCGLCGGEVGPDITGRLMCYGCGPAETAPRDVRERLRLEGNGVGRG